MTTTTTTTSELLTAVVRLVLCRLAWLKTNTKTPKGVVYVRAYGKGETIELNQKNKTPS